MNQLRKNNPLLVRIIGLVAIVILLLNVFILYQINKTEAAEVPIGVFAAKGSILKDTEGIGQDNVPKHDNIKLLLLLESGSDDLDLNFGKIIVEIPVLDQENKKGEGLVQMNKSDWNILTKNDSLLQSKYIKFNSANVTDLPKAINHFAIKGTFKDTIMTQFDIIPITIGKLPVNGIEGLETLRVRLYNFDGYESRTFHIPLRKSNIFETNGKVGLSTLNPETKLHVNGRISDSTGAVMPVGGIIRWSDTVLPSGWAWYDITTGEQNDSARCSDAKKDCYIKKL